jgi:hypothetical protein
MSDTASSERAAKKKKPQAAAKPDIQSLGVELGSEANLPFSVPFNPAAMGTGKNADEELQEIIREESEEFGPTVRQLVAMRRLDGQARALYRLLVLPIRAALTTSTFVPAEDGEAEAEFIEQVFNTPPESGGMTVTFHRFMSQLLQGLFDGFAAFEKVFWMPDTGPLSGKYTLQKMAHRPADTITFVVDKKGGFAGLRQRAFNANKTVDVYIPRENSFYFAAQEEERKFYGVSFFQSAFYHYDKKVKMYYIMHLTAQRAAVGTRVGTVPPNATNAAKTEFAAQLNNLSLAQWMMMPEGFKVEALKEGGAFGFMDAINHHNSQMSKSILAPFFDDNEGASAGDSSLVNFGKPGDEMFMLMLRSIMDDVANQINHYIIPQLIDFNFSGGKYPKFTWGKLTDEQKAAIANTFDKLLASPGNVTPEFIRALEEHQAEEFGLEIDYDEVDAREEQEAAQQANIDPTTGLPFEGTDPVTGQPLPADETVDPEADREADPAAPAKAAAGAAAKAAVSVADAAASIPNPKAKKKKSPMVSLSAPAPEDDDEEEYPGKDLGLEADWTPEDFEAAMRATTPDEGEEDPIERLERGIVKLTPPPTAEASLIALAHEMLDMASEAHNGS